MEFFIDTANIEEIKRLNKTGMVDGVTTNPTLIAKEGRDFHKTIAEIAAIVDGPVSAEVISTDYEGMMKEAEPLMKIAENVAIKLPMTWDGLKACREITSGGNMVNITLCFSASQALLAAKAGATFVSPFVGRVDDISADGGMKLIAEISTIYSNYAFDTNILVASIRSPNHVVQSAVLGADIATLPPKVLDQLINHQLTDIGLDTFINDWNNVKSKFGPAE